MKKWHIITGALLLGTIPFIQVYAQTQYGMGAGMVGTSRAFFGTDGNNNTVMGNSAGYFNISGLENVFLGYKSGCKTTGEG